LSACGSSTDPVSACKTVIEIFCNKDFQCYPNESQLLYGSLSNCVSTRQAATCTPAQTASIRAKQTSASRDTETGPAPTS
jgi:hypothetical protein